ncbi:MAG: hypothetical protein ACODAJ_07770, partial [Planctomycetota bacterium]
MPVTRPNRSPRRWLLGGCAFALVAAAVALVGTAAWFRKPLVAMLRPPPPIEYPETKAVEWQEEAAATDGAPEPGSAVEIDTDVVPVAAQPAAEPPAEKLPVALDLARPVRIAWPLDVGPDISPDAPDDRLCLRARQGANELLTVGRGDALYAVRLVEGGRCRVWFRARYARDEVGDTQCNNSLRVVVNDRAPVLIGNDNVSSRWAWRRGPGVQLRQGLNWLRLELREDGPMLDRLALVPGESKRPPDGLDALQPVPVGGLAGERDPRRPQRPVQDVEIFALPTRSLVVGAGHVNEITVAASWQALDGDGFEGTIAIHSTTAERITASGDRRVACGPDQPFGRSVVELKFAPETPRRAHQVIVTVADPDGREAFRDDLRFVKPFAWAFLGPFPEPARDGDQRQRTGRVIDASRPCERSPIRLARLEQGKRLGLDESREWTIVADGSCCDWTGAVDLYKVFGPTEHAFAYAVTWLDSRHGLSRRLLSLQADDATWLWVNGAFLVQMPMELPKEGNRLWTSARLRRGPNPVVLKLTQAKAY